MSPLETSQLVLMWLSGVPPHESEHKLKKIAIIAFSLMMIIFAIVAEMASITFIYRNVSTNLEETLFCLFHTITVLQTIYQLIAKVLLRYKLIVIFENLLTIYNRSKLKHEILF